MSDALYLAAGWIAYVWGRSAGRREWSAVILVIGILALINVAIAVHQVTFPTNQSVFYGDVAVKGMAIGLYAHYNHLANFLLLAAFLSLGMAISDGRPSPIRIFSWLVFVACFGGLILTQSRGGILAAIAALFVAVGLWLLTLWRRKVSWAPHLTLGLVVLMPVLAFAAYQFGRQAVFERGTNDGGRWAMSRAAMELVLKEPIFGHGSRAYSYQCWDPVIWQASGMRHDYADPVFVHNELLQAACDYGLVGLTLVLLVIGATFFRGLVIVAIAQEDRQSEQSDSGAVMGGLIAMTAMMVQSVFSFVFHTFPDVIIFALCMGYITQQIWPLDDLSQSRKISWLPWLMRLTHASVVIGACLMFWRLAVVWLIVDCPLVNRVKTPLQQEQAWLRASYWLNDFRIHQALGLSYASALPRDVASGQMQQTRRLAEAYDQFCEVEKRHPWEYISILNQALMLDDLGRYDQAEPIFQRALVIFSRREIVYRAHYYYMRHLTRRAALAWENFDPGYALWLYQTARDQLDITRASGAIGHELYGQLLQVINERMDFLVKQNIIPSDQPLPQTSVDGIDVSSPR